MNQRGSALSYAMLAVAFGSATVAYVASILKNQQVEGKIYESQAARDAIGRNIGEYLTNPLIILASATQGAALPGNNVLSNCLGNPDPISLKSTATALLNGSVVGGGGCTIPNTATGMEFLLIPPSTYWMPACNAVQQAAPAGSRPLTCFFAGNKSGQRMAYNFDGNTSPNVADVNYPLEVRVYFKPLCRISNPSQLNCQFAEALQFRYEIQQMVNVPNRITLGLYPTQTTWLTLNSSTIIQTQCNNGAILTANDASGAFQCQCYRPYVPLVQNGLPVVNPQGPVCVSQASCAVGYTLIGHDANSNAICQKLISTIVNLPGTSYSTDDPPQGHTCNPNNNGGWVSNVTRSCYSEYNLSYKQCPTGCSKDWWPIVVGAIVAIFALMITAIVTTALSFIPIIGWPFIPISLAARTLAMNTYVIAGVAGGGALAGYFMSQTDYDWLYIDQNNGHNPHIYCNVSLECGNIVASGGSSGSGSSSSSSSSGSSSGSGSGSGGSGSGSSSGSSSGSGGGAPPYNIPSNIPNGLYNVASKICSPPGSNCTNLPDEQNLSLDPVSVQLPNLLNCPPMNPPMWCNITINPFDGVKFTGVRTMNTCQNGACQVSETDYTATYVPPPAPPPPVP